MIFDSFAYYFLFLVPAAVLFRVVRPGLRPMVCSLFGAAFFVYFSLTQLGGRPGAACLLIFVWESIFSRLYRSRSIFCVVGIIQSILILVAFKYWNFLTGLIFGAPATNPVFWPGAFLPIGISFFTFEFIHYAADRYRGTTPAGRFQEYLAFILFYPTMVAGPIKRYQDFLPQLIQPSLDWTTDWQRGITRILCGLVKKIAIADVLSALTDNLHHETIASADRRILPLWLLAYAFKIYFDFSGYSDIAIGSARLFGIRVPENFNWPYLSTNIIEFWRRWHISLYRWLVDYVYIPLGGSRAAPTRIYRNVMLTILVAGIWHGAGLHYVLFGMYHGLLVCGYRFWTAWRRPVLEITASSGALATASSWALTFVAVNMGFVFFCMDVPTSLFFLRRLFLG
jgi:alginate O-acetyltransferase complex protein AlgI